MVTNTGLETPTFRSEFQRGNHFTITLIVCCDRLSNESLILHLIFSTLCSRRISRINQGTFLTVAHTSEQQTKSNVWWIADLYKRGIISTYQNLQKRSVHLTPRHVHKYQHASYQSYMNMPVLLLTFNNQEHRVENYSFKVIYWVNTAAEKSLIIFFD